MTNELCIANKQLKSRLLLGTGKFANASIMKDAIIASESEIITVAIRRVDLTNPQDAFTQIINPSEYVFLPNTSGARTADEAVKIAHLARASEISNWVKLEVIPDAKYLLPDPIETLRAAERLVNDGFIVLPYINADPILAKRLEDIGCATVMPLAAPIGSNRGLKTKELIRIIIEQATVPVIVDAGLGTPSQAAEAMELGADAVLVNTAIATAPNPIAYATAFKLATQAGRIAYESGIPLSSPTATASSPLTGFLR